MTGIVIFAVIALAAVLLLFWLARERRQPPRTGHESSSPPIEELFPLHCKYLPQIRQALSASDRDYLKQRASSVIRRKSWRERRAVARQFLAGLREDFLKLDRLGRTIAALSPEVSRRLEAERVWLAVRFHALYGIVWLRLGLGGLALPQLAHLADLVGGLAAHLEAAMTALERNAAQRVSSSLSA